MKRYLILILICISSAANTQNTDFLSVPAGLKNTGPLTLQDAIVLNNIEEVILPDHYRYKTLPDSVDNSAYEWFRPIFSQEVYPNCMQSTSIAYNFTYEVNRLRGLPADTSDNQYTTHFAWNFFNGGNGWFGVNYLFTMDVLKHHGTPNNTDYGGFYYGGGERWMSGYDEWYNAMNNRISGIRKIYVGNEEGLLTLKNWLCDHLDGSETGGLASFIACSPYGLRSLPPESPHAGKKVLTAWCPEALHGMTIVGYNDSIRYDYNGDGFYTNDIDLNADGIIDMKDREVGALKFANSHGDNFANDGFCFMMYKTLADDFSNGGIWSNTVHILDVKEEHETRMTYKVSLEHDYRERIRVQAGVSSNLESNKPEHIHSYTIFNYQGGWHYMQGNDTTPDHKTIEFGLDVTPLLSFVEPGQPYKFFLIVDERDPQNLGIGQINYFSLMDYGNGLDEIPCDQQNVPLVRDGRTFLSVIYSPSFDKPVITTEDLPLYVPGQPIEVQLEVERGQAPYSWHFDKNYRMNNNNADFPEIDEHLIMTSSLEDSITVQHLDFSFPFYGNHFDSVMVSSSGYLSFDENMYFWSYLVDMAYFLKNKRVVAPFLCPDMIVFDFYENGIWYEGDENIATFRWKTTLTEQAGSSVFNFAVSLYPDGNIDFYYGDIEVLGDVRWVSGIADGDFVNYSLPELPVPTQIPTGTKIEFIANELPAEVSMSKDGVLSILENTESAIRDIQVLATDNTLLSAAKTFQLTEGLEIKLEVQGSEKNIISNGQVAYINLIVQNRGSSSLTNIEFILDCNNPMIQLLDYQYSIENLQAGEIVEITGAFSCLSDKNIADEQYIILHLEAITTENNFKRSYYLETSSPSMEIKEVEVLNEPGILEQGQTSDIQINLINIGSRKSINTNAKLVCDDPGVSINGSQSMSFGTILPGNIASAEFSLTADYSIPYGALVNFTVEITDEIGLSKELPFSMRVGKVPICIVDMDAGHNSGPLIHELLQQMDVETEYTLAFPNSLDNYQSVILCLGIQYSFHEITYNQSIILTDYLDQGGNLYMEGRVAWEQDPLWQIFDRFNIETTITPALYEVLDGVDSTFTEGLSYENIATWPFCYFSMEPVPPAYSILTGRDYPYCAAVAHDAGTYKTIGTIFELGALISSDTCQIESFIEEVLEFFGVLQSVIGIEEVPVEDRAVIMQNYPNPFSNRTRIPLILDKSSHVDAAIYDLRGRRIYELTSASNLTAGHYSFSWDGSNMDGNPVPGGIYIYRLIIDGKPYTGKMILIR